MKHKYDDIFIEDQKLLTLTYDVFEDNVLHRIKCTFENNDIVIVDPYIIGLSLLMLPKEVIDANKKALSNKKVLQFYRNSVPYEDLLYFLTGGEMFWNKFKWDFDIAFEFWKDQFVETISGCFTIYDLVLFLNYFKNDVVDKSFNSFMTFYMSSLEEKNMKM